jgi:hypothetical protein
MQVAAWRRAVQGTASRARVDRGADDARRRGREAERLKQDAQQART